MTEFLRNAGELPARPTPHVAAQRSRPRKARARARTPGAGEGLDGENDVVPWKRTKAVQLSVEMPPQVTVAVDSRSVTCSYNGSQQDSVSG
jgi:hypothetical protein